MAMEKVFTDIPMAQIVLCDDGMFEVHIRPDVRIDGAGLLGSMEARRSLLAGRSGPILILAPGDLDREPSALQTDFFGPDESTITAFAEMVDSKVLGLVANMYFGLFPARFPAKVCNDETQAREWLKGER